LRASRRDSAADVYRVGKSVLEQESQSADAALPLQIFAYAVMPYDEAHRQAWTGPWFSLVLLCLLSSFSDLSPARGRHQGGQLMEAAGIHVKDLNAWFGATQALHSISMEISCQARDRDFGPSGCGKSTFVRCLKPDA